MLFDGALIAVESVNPPTLFVQMCFSPTRQSPRLAKHKTPGFTPLSQILRLLLAGMLIQIGLLKSSAWAVGLSQDGTGGRAAGMGGLGTTVADDPLSALFNNPAALADLGARPTAQIGGEIGILGGSFHNVANNDATLGTVAGIGQFAASVPVGPFSFGIGLNPRHRGACFGPLRGCPRGR